MDNVGRTMLARGFVVIGRIPPSQLAPYVADSRVVAEKLDARRSLMSAKAS